MRAVRSSFFDYSQSFFLIKALWCAETAWGLRIPEFSLPVIIGPGINPVSGANPADPILVAFLKNLELLFSRALSLGLDAVSPIPPDPIGLIANAVLGTHGLHAGFLTLCKNLKPLLRGEVLFGLDSSGLVAPDSKG